LDGLKQLVAKLFLGVVQRKIQEIETRMGYRQIRVATNSPLDDYLRKKMKLIAKTSQ
jgi:hypothetical protein